MPFFQPIIDIKIEHSYFADRCWRGLQFEASKDSQKIFEVANMIWRSNEQGISIHIDPAKQAVLDLYADRDSGLVALLFKVRAADKAFASYTAPAQRTDGRILYFNNQLGFSQAEFVSEQDLVPFEQLLAQGVLTAADKRMPPIFLLHLHFKPSGELLQYRLKFLARQSWWKYYLLGNMADKQAAIVDLDNQFEFEYCGEVVVANNRAAKLFKSKQPIPVQEKSNYRFQLKEIAQHPHRVLIRRLVVASESRLGLELIDGKSELVFENFVNF